MAQEISFDDFYAKVKAAYFAKGITVPEDIELIELAHMEMLADETPADQFIEKMIEESGG